MSLDLLAEQYRKLRGQYTRSTQDIFLVCRIWVENIGMTPSEMAFAKFLANLKNDQTLSEPVRQAITVDFMAGDKAFTAYEASLKEMQDDETR